MEGFSQESYCNNIDNDVFQGVEEMAVGLEAAEEIDEHSENIIGDGLIGSNDEQYITVECSEDFGKINLRNLTEDDVKNCQFADLKLAFEFYKRYAKMKGFAPRRSKVLRNKKGEVVQQTFLCSNQGFREERYKNAESRQRLPKPETRCGCEARMRVHVFLETGRWHVTIFNDEHNHDLLGGMLTGMLPAHRRMDEDDIGQMNNLRKAGISTSQIYSSLASQSGGFQYVGFGKRDMYNQIQKQRRLQEGDARGALSFLRGLASSDPAMFWKHTVDAEGKLQHLFWCDGTSQLDYELFGDVVAFDATYGKNKYRLPLVVFSGVNHHNMTTVFATAVVANETEETYVWLLEQFAATMKGKSPKSIVTDGDLAMRNAISRVFPNAHHRLCA